MKKQNNSPLAEASTKLNLEAARLLIDLPMLDVNVTEECCSCSAKG